MQNNEGFDLRCKIMKVLVSDERLNVPRFRLLLLSKRFSTFADTGSKRLRGHTWESGAGTACTHGNGAL